MGEEESSSKRRRSSLWDDEPEESYSYYDDEEAFMSGYKRDDYYGSRRRSRSSLFDDDDDEPSMYETRSDREERRRIEELKKQNSEFKLSKLDDDDSQFNIFNFMDNNPDDFEISDEWEDSIRGRVERNKNKAKYDAKSDDSDNIAKMLFSRSLNGGLLREATDSGIQSILQRSPL